MTNFVFTEEASLITIISISVFQVLMVNLLNPRVYFDIEIEKKYKGRIVMELFADTVPVTAENFRYVLYSTVDIPYGLLGFTLSPQTNFEIEP